MNKWIWLALLIAVFGVAGSTFAPPSRTLRDPFAPHFDNAFYLLDPKEHKIDLDWVYARGSGGIGLYDDGGNPGVFVEDGGQVGIGTETPSSALEVNGEITVTSMFADFIDFNTVYVDGVAEGRLQWNIDDGTLEFGLPGGNVNLQIGQEQLIRARNTTGSTITNGQAVRITGSSGSRPTIGLAEADVPASAGAIGVVTEDIANNQNGYVATFGLVRDVNTAFCVAGDRLFVSNTAGELTLTPPVGDERIIFIGTCLFSNATSGVIFVTPINVSYLRELSGVTITNVADDEIIVYDAATDTYINTSDANFTSLIVSDNATAPQAAVANTSAHFAGVDAAVSRILLDSYGNVPAMTFRRASGTAASPTAVQLNDNIGELSFHAYGATGYSGNGNAHLQTWAAENWTDAAQGTYMTFDVTPVGSTSEAKMLRLDSTGRVNIGVDQAPETLLHLNGAHVGALGMIYVDSTDDAFIALESTGTSDAGILLRDDAVPTWQIKSDGDSNDLNIVTRVGGDNIRWTMEQGGDVTFFQDVNVVGTSKLQGKVVHDSSVLTITAAGGITPIKSAHGIQGDGGPIDITANPQIVAGVSGQILVLEGRSDTNTVQIDDGDGVHLHGRAIIGQEDVITLQYDGVDAEWAEVSRNFSESEKAWSFASPVGSAGTFYTGGYYLFAAADDDFNPATTHGEANISYAAHVLFVQAAGASGGVDTVVRVSGTTIDDDGTRTTGVNVDVSIDDAGAAGTYYETSEKWIGQVTLTKQSGPDLLCNYGFCKYWDNNNNDFRIIGIEVTGRAGANDTNPNVFLRHHKATGWTYNNAAAPTPPAAVVNMNTDHNTEIQYRIGQNFAWKRSNLLENVTGGNGEGTIIEWFTGANKSVDIAHVLLRIRGN